MMHWSLTERRIAPAANPPYGLRAATGIATINVPAGTTIYQGFAGPQSTGVGELLGGGSQVYIPYVDPVWLNRQ